MARKRHEFDNQTLKVSAYRDKFGIIPPNHDTSQPSVQIPTHVNITGIDPFILQYWKNIPLAREHLKKELAKLHSQLDPNFNIDKELRILCTITEDNIEARSHVKVWATDVKETVNALVSCIQVKRRLCVKKIWDLVLEKAKKVKQENKDVFLVKKDEESAIYVVGPTAKADTAYNQFDQICFELEQSMEQIKTKIELKGTDRLVFLKSAMMEKLKRDRPKMKMLLGQKDIEVEGPPRDILDTQNEIYSFMKLIEHRSLQLSAGKLKVLNAHLQKQNSYLEQSMKNLAAVIQVKSTTAVISGATDDIRKCEEILKNDIKETVQKISDEEKVALSDKIWTPFYDSLNKQSGGMMYLEVKTHRVEINIAAHKTDFNMILETVRQHLRKNTIKTAVAKVGKFPFKYIQRHMEKDLREIEQSFSSYSIKIEPSDDYSFKISGTEDGLTPAKKRVEGLKDPIRTKTYVVNSSGMLNYFMNDVMGQLFIKHTEDSNQVLIHHDGFRWVEEPQSGLPEEKQVKGPPFHIPEDEWVKEPQPDILENPQVKETTFHKPFSSLNSSTGQTFKEIEKVTHSTGVTIMAVVGNLPTHPVEIIVNAANGKLMHVGGLAKAIVDAGVYTYMNN